VPWPKPQRPEPARSPTTRSTRQIKAEFAAGRRKRNEPVLHGLREEELSERARRVWEHSSRHRAQEPDHRCAQLRLSFNLKFFEAVSCVTLPSGNRDYIGSLV
jgi:hypothetical protein